MPGCWDTSLPSGEEFIYKRHCWIVNDCIKYGKKIRFYCSFSVCIFCAYIGKHYVSDQLIIFSERSILFIILLLCLYYLSSLCCLTTDYILFVSVFFLLLLFLPFCFLTRLSVPRTCLHLFSSISLSGYLAKHCTWWRAALFTSILLIKPGHRERKGNREYFI